MWGISSKTWYSTWTYNYIWWRHGPHIPSHVDISHITLIPLCMKCFDSLNKAYFMAWYIKLYVIRAMFNNISREYVGIRCLYQKRLWEQYCFFTQAKNIYNHGCISRNTYIAGVCVELYAYRRSMCWVVYISQEYVLSCIHIAGVCVELYTYRTSKFKLKIKLLGKYT